MRALNRMTSSLVLWVVVFSGAAIVVTADRWWPQIIRWAAAARSTPKQVEPIGPPTRKIFPGRIAPQKPRLIPDVVVSEKGDTRGR